MSAENNNFMTTITKNPLVSGIVVVVIIILIVLIVKMSGSEEAFSHPSSSDNKDIVENYPQSTPMNVMYSDASGNLGTTTDLGLQNLTVKSDSSFGGNVGVSGSATVGGLIDTPSLNRNSGDWLRVNDQGASVGQTAMYGGVCINDTRQAHGGLSVGDWNSNVGQGNIRAAGTISAGSTISTSRGYGIIDNRSVNPNQLSGGHVQLGFGSMANNGSAPFADTIHLNGWGDASGQRPNLVMFDKSKPGMRIYQGDWNSTSAYTTYNDAVMADSGGNASIGGALSAGSVKTGGNIHGTGRMTIGGDMSDGVVNIKNRDGRYSHFGWTDNKNYIRGDTQLDGNLNVNGVLALDDGNGNRFTFSLETDNTPGFTSNGKRMAIRNAAGRDLLHLYQNPPVAWNEGNGNLPTSIFPSQDVNVPNRSILNIRDYGTVYSTNGCGNQSIYGHLGCNWWNNRGIWQ